MTILKALKKYTGIIVLATKIFNGVNEGRFKPITTIYNRGLKTKIPAYSCAGVSASFPYGENHACISFRIPGATMYTCTIKFDGDKIESIFFALDFLFVYIDVENKEASEYIKKIFHEKGIESLPHSEEASITM